MLVTGWAGAAGAAGAGELRIPRRETFDVLTLAGAALILAGLELVRQVTLPRVLRPAGARVGGDRAPEPVRR